MNNQSFTNLFSAKGFTLNHNELSEETSPPLTKMEPNLNLLCISLIRLVREEKLRFIFSLVEYLFVPY